jgi:hypothetical protein
VKIIKNNLIFAGTLFLSALTILTVTTASAQTVVGSVTELTGSAKLTRSGVTSPVTNAMPVDLQDTLATDSGSPLTVRLNDGSTLSLAESSTIVINEQVIGAGGVRQSTRVGLLAGRLYAVVSATLSGGAPTFQVNTPNAIAGVRGTRFNVSFSSASPVCGDRPSSDVGVLEGEVGVNNVRASGGGVVVGAGYETVVCGGAPPLPPGPLGLAGDGTGSGAAGGYSGAQPGAGGAPPPGCPVCPACTGKMM